MRAGRRFRREPRNQEIFEDVNARYRDANIWSNRLISTYGPAVNLLGRVTTTSVLLYGGSLAMQGQVTLGILTGFALYLRQFFGPMQELSQFYNVFQAAGAALEKLAGVIEEAPTVPEPAVPVRLGAVQGAVAFEHVTFAYRDKPVLHDIDIRVPSGQIVALVGETGAGKTTTARMIAAAKAIGAHEFIAAMPNGYDTDVWRRGVRLSSGQRQLVAFARAFLADPRVLILDEATSSLDLPSERLVQRALRTLLRGRTAFIIAHRLSTVEIADRVLVIDAGRGVEDGPPLELRAREGRYGSFDPAGVRSVA